MIACLSGNIVGINTTSSSFIIKAGSVGYEVTTNSSTIDQLTEGDDCLVYTHTHIGESIFALYGFLNQQDLKLFKLLISVSGIGPKAAVNIMSTPSDQLVSAIKGADIAKLTSIKGIGYKTAEHLIIELKDKLDGQNDSLGNLLPTTEANREAVDALVSLGYSAREAKIAIAKLPSGFKTSEEIVRATLAGTGAK